MLLLLVFLICAAALTVLLWAGTLFFQGYFYTEPTQDIHWQAPAAGGALALFLTLWCLIVLNSAEAGPGDIPYDTILRFSPRVDRFKEPVKELWVERKKQTLKYVRHKDPQGGVRYQREGSKEGFPRGPVDAIVIKEDNRHSRFLPIASPSGEYRLFQDEEGWIMQVTTDGPTGNATAFRWGRFLANLFLNLFHLVVWFVCLWLLLRFQWPHALGMAFVMWLVMTLAILPMLFEQAALQARRNATSQASATQAHGARGARAAAEKG